jgi:hypothetical protein
MKIIFTLISCKIFFTNKGRNKPIFLSFLFIHQKFIYNNLYGKYVYKRFIVNNFLIKTIIFKTFFMTKITFTLQLHCSRGLKENGLNR